jgi:inner membrane protein YidH
MNHPLSPPKKHREIPEEARSQEHLANERTFLSWVRTTIALVSLGFVIARLGLWLREAGVNASKLSHSVSPIGVGLMGFGALLTVLAAWRYDAVNRQIEAGQVSTDRALVWFVTLAVAVISIALIIYMIADSAQ